MTKLKKRNSLGRGGKNYFDALQAKLFFTAILIGWVSVNIQLKASPTPFIKSKDVFNNAVFVENKGQYDGFDPIARTVFYGLENSGHKFEFTKSGFYCRFSTVSRKPMTILGITLPISSPESELEGHYSLVEMEWIGSNPAVTIEAANVQTGYYSYLLYDNLSAKNKEIQARSYTKLIYHDLYPGIDAVYTVMNDSLGFKYNLIVRPGADVSVVKLKYKGEVQNVQLQSDGSFKVQTDNGFITEKKPVAWNTGNPLTGVSVNYEIKNDTISFQFPYSYLNTDTLVIDPVVVTDLTSSGFGVGSTATKVDYDVSGNLYVYGGTYPGPYNVSKFNSLGTWLWTFSGNLSSPSWTSYPYGYLSTMQVEFGTGKVYVGQGFNSISGAATIRLNTNGGYDNFITSTIANAEVWSFAQNCSTGEVLMLGGNAGGSTSVGVFSSGSGTTTYKNFSGYLTGYQDVVSSVFDENGELYCVMASSLTAFVNNKIFKLNTGYGSYKWAVSTGYTTLVEANNMPGFAASSTNTGNMLAVNNDYLYFYDGINLAAYNKSTGASVGTPLNLTSFTAKYQQGIAVDRCNNVYIGGIGEVKAYNFNGSTFTALGNISLGSSFASANVYDVRLHPQTNMLYVSGKGFSGILSASYSANCSSMSVTTSVVFPCVGAITASASLSGNFPGSYLSYTWTDLSGNVISTTSNTSSLSSSITNLIAGNTYILNANYNSTCRGEHALATVVVKTTPDVVLVANTSKTDVLCYSLATGTASVSLTNGTAPFTYSWSPSGGTSNSATNLAAGSYTCNISDANGCTVAKTIAVAQPASAVSSSIQSQTNISCFGNNTGQAAVSASGGSPGYNYNWTGGLGTSSSVSNLAAGNYTCTVTDANGCSYAQAVSITQPASALASGILTQTNVNCFGNNTGQVSISASGGTAAYTYNWSGGLGTSSSLSNLAAGNYTCTLTDANGCAKTQTVSITQPAAALTTSIQSQSNINCYGEKSGQAIIAVSGGTPAYTYSWSDNYGTASTANNLVVGTYTCTVTDANGCAQTQTVSITQPASAISTSILSLTDVSCFGNTTGQASINVSGGTAAYAYNWSGGLGTSSSITNIAAGSYTCTVTDAKGCTKTQAVSISQPAAALTTSIQTQTNVNCFGDNTGQVNLSVSGGTSAYSYSWSGGLGTSSSLLNVAAGNYTCTVTDANGCTKTQAVSISQPAAALTTSIQTQTNVNCFGENTGQVNLSVSGGTSAYSYNWTGGLGASSSLLNLAAGNYTCTVTDANGCTKTQPVSITQPTNALSATIQSQTNVNCFGENTGQVNLSVSGGTSAYTYSWVGGLSSTSSLTNIAAGSYTCTVTDANGCQETQVIAITQPVSALSTSIQSQTNVNCYGDNTGQATVLATGGTTSYTYNWSAGIGNTAAVSNLTAGTYTCTVTDNNGCTAVNQITITQPAAALTIQLQQKNDIACMGDNTGMATVQPNGGTTGYTYNWLPFGGNAATATQLTAGTYTCEITDANGCKASEILSLSQPSTGLSSSVTSVKHVSCYNANNGQIDVSAIGGSPAYAYSWAPIGGALPQATNLPAGTYTCTITDNNLCKSLQVVQVTQPASALSMAVSSVQQVNCYGDATGAATVQTTGGTPVYSYNWLPSGGTANTATGLVAGNYTCTVTDNNGCIENKNIIISQPSSPLTVALNSSQNIACFGDSTGVASVVANGGTTAYSYTWLPYGGNSSSAVKLVAGNYTCEVTDANGCKYIQPVSLSQPTAALTGIVSLKTNVACYKDSTGQISLQVSGGTPSYTYSWAPYGGTSAQANHLAAGTFTCTITDNNACKRTEVVQISQPSLALTATVQTSNNVSCFGDSNGSVSILVTGGTPAYTYNWSPLTVNGAAVNGLPAGSYSCIITDFNACKSTISVNITQPSAALSGVLGSQVNNRCFGDKAGMAALTMSGGTPQYTYTWMPSGGNTAIASNLPAGTYTCTVLDAANCIFKQTVQITEPPALSVNAIGDTVCLGDTSRLSVSVSGGTAPYNCIWTNTGDHAFTMAVLQSTDMQFTVIINDGNNCTVSKTVQSLVKPLPNAAFKFDSDNGVVYLYSGKTNVCLYENSVNVAAWQWNWNNTQSSVLQNPCFELNATGQYCVSLKATSEFGCTNTTTQCLVAENNEFVIPNVFTPNNDSKNDFFFITAKGFKSFYCVIYDRWGLKLYDWYGDKGSWDGKLANGEMASDGVYYYFLELKNYDDKPITRNGFFELVK